MISSVVFLTLMSLFAQNFHSENDKWEGNAHTDTKSVEVIGTSARRAIMKTAPHRQLSQNDINRQRLINKYGLEKVQALENGTLDNLDLMILTYLPGETPQSNLVTISDVARLGVDSGSISLQPSRGWAYVNKPVYLHSDTTSVTKETTILGDTVTITATPVSYTWHCGDGHTFTTKDAGGTWAQGGTVTHSYTRSGTYTLSTDIMWRASYTVNGHTYPVNGTLTTTSTEQTIKIVEAEAVLTY